MDLINALGIARLALATHKNIEPEVKDGRYNHNRYIPAESTRECADAAEAYNTLADLQLRLTVIDAEADERLTRRIVEHAHFFTHLKGCSH